MTDCLAGFLSFFRSLSINYLYPLPHPKRRPRRAAVRSRRPFTINLPLSTKHEKNKNKMQWIQTLQVVGRLWTFRNVQIYTRDVSLAPRSIIIARQGILLLFFNCCVRWQVQQSHCSTRRSRRRIRRRRRVRRGIVVKLSEICRTRDTLGLVSCSCSSTFER